MTDSRIAFFCCDEHNDAYIEARRRSRIQGVDPTPEELRIHGEIDEHLSRQRNESN